MPTAATHTFTPDTLQPAFNPDDAQIISVKLKVSTTFPKGAVLAWDPINQYFIPYVHGTPNAATLGASVPVAVLKYAITTDGNSGYTLNQNSGVRYDAPAYVTGIFRIEDLSVGTSAGQFDPANAVIDAYTWQYIKTDNATAASITAGLVKIG